LPIGHLLTTGYDIAFFEASVLKQAETTFKVGISWIAFDILAENNLLYQNIKSAP
jgi:hypothetical protein